MATNLRRSSSGVLVVLCFLEDALVEREPRQLAVDEQTVPVGAHARTPVGRTISARPNVSMNMSARAVAASCSMVRSPTPSTSRIQVGSLRRSRRPRDLLQVFGVERVGEAQNRRQLVDDQAVLTIERRVGQVAALRRPAPVVPRDVGDDGRLVVGEAEDLQRRQQVLRVLVVGAQADVDADVVQQRGHLKEQPLASGEAVVFPALVEQPHREHRDVAAVRAIEPVAMADRFGARQHLVLEVGCAQPAARRGEVEQDAGPQRGVGHDDPAGRRFRQQRPVHQQGGHERLGLDGRKTEPVDQLLLVQPLDRVAEARGRRRASPSARRLPFRSRGSAMPRTARRRRSRPCA